METELTILGGGRANKVLEEKREKNLHAFVSENLDLMKTLAWKCGDELVTADEHLDLVYKLYLVFKVVHLIWASERILFLEPFVRGIKGINNNKFPPSEEERNGERKKGYKYFFEVFFAYVHVDVLHVIEGDQRTNANKEEADSGLPRTRLWPCSSQQIGPKDLEKSGVSARPPTAVDGMIIMK